MNPELLHEARQLLAALPRLEADQFARLWARCGTDLERRRLIARKTPPQQA